MYDFLPFKCLRSFYASSLDIPIGPPIGVYTNVVGT
jgi:hypothetical protein